MIVRFQCLCFSATTLRQMTGDELVMISKTCVDAVAIKKENNTYILNLLVFDRYISLNCHDFYKFAMYPDRFRTYNKEYHTQEQLTEMRASSDAGDQAKFQTLLQLVDKSKRCVEYHPHIDVELDNVAGGVEVPALIVENETHTVSECANDKNPPTDNHNDADSMPDLQSVSSSFPSLDSDNMSDLFSVLSDGADNSAEPCDGVSSAKGDLLPVVSKEEECEGELFI